MNESKRIKRRKVKFLSNLARKVRMVVFDFDGVFTDNRVVVLEDGEEGVFCCRSDGIGLSMLKKLGVELLVISSEVNPVVSVRCKKLNLRCIQDSNDKLKIVKQEARRLNLSLKEIAYLGNDINDIACLREMGLSACVRDAHPDVQAIAQYVTNLPGGYGAVREFCDFIREAKNGKIS